MTMIHFCSLFSLPFFFLFFFFFFFCKFWKEFKSNSILYFMILHFIHHITAYVSLLCKQKLFNQNGLIYTISLLVRRLKMSFLFFLGFIIYQQLWLKCDHLHRIVLCLHLLQITEEIQIQFQPLVHVVTFYPSQYCLRFFVTQQKLLNQEYSDKLAKPLKI